jgi:SAM-dependent methyltransferase
MKDVRAIRDDFDAIAALDPEPWADRNAAYHGRLLREIGGRAGRALDVGCGLGDFTALLAERAALVDAIDLSPRMIDEARSRHAALRNVSWQVADVLVTPPPPDTYDVVVTLATLHHLPLEVVVPRLAAAVRPGGALLILDLLAIDGALDLPRAGSAWLYDRFERLVRTGRVRPSRAVREAWERHGRGEVYLRWREARETYARLLPGARLRRHWFGRYSVLWRRS